MVEHVKLELGLNINGEFHIHHHHHHLPNPSQPGVADILNSIRDLRNAIMTQLDISAAKESQDTDSLVAAVEHLADALEQLRSENNVVLRDALNAANLDMSQQAAVLDANDSAVDAALTRANNLLNAAPAGQDTAGGTGGNDSGAGGGGTDTSASSGDDSVTDSAGNDTVSGDATDPVIEV